MSKVAILVDGGFFLKRLPSVRKDINTTAADEVDKALGQLVSGHLKQLAKQQNCPAPFSLLYRSFFYDARPYLGKGQRPISKRQIDYSKTDQATFRDDLFNRIRKRPNFALRLGTVRKEQSWIITEKAQKALLSGARLVSELTDDDFYPGLRQKAVDMRLGLDIASLTLKKQADTIVLVTGDADFVPAAKLARREGVKIVLDPLWQNVSDELFEHIDQLRSGFFRPGTLADAELVGVNE